MGQLQFQAAIVLFLVLNGHLVYLQAYAHSFEMVPPLRFPPLDGTGLALDEIVRATSGLFVTALQLAVPAVIVVFLIDVGFGILNRLSPSVNVFSLSQPVKMLAGLLVTVLVLPALFLLLQDRMAEMLALVSRFIDAIGGAGP
jgi:flagellar biosynthetic protein FliR